jgi:ATP-dependent Clp protease ATP-binding subunit ClpC
VIVFQPLTRDLMRVILKKELTEVLERRGLKDRAWAVEWEASALEFLLEKGFSPEMGARPLKRAIDQYVIAPLAETIVERRFPEGEQFVFFRSDGRSIKAEFVDPDSDATPAPLAEVEVAARPPALAAMILTARGSAAEFEALTAECTSIDRALASPQWEELKQQLAQEMSQADFWQSPARFAKLARLALMDRVAAAVGTVGGLRTRLARVAGAQGHYSRDLVARLALQLHLIKEGVEDVFEGAPVEVALAVEPALEGSGVDKPATEAWCRELLAMYRAWSGNRHMQTSELDGSRAQLPALVVSGFGAHRVLARECGLHIFELAGNGASRATARVRLVATPLGDVPAHKLQKDIAAALEQAPRPSTVVRRYRRDPAPLVRNADGSWRTGRLDAVLRGDFDLLAADEGGGTE